MVQGTFPDGRAFYGNICSGVPIYMIIDLILKNKQVLIVGGGNESARKVEALLTQQCDIIVVAERVDKSIKQHADDGKITLELRKIENIEFVNKYNNLILILATTDNRKLNRDIVLFGKSNAQMVLGGGYKESSKPRHAKNLFEANLDCKPIVIRVTEAASVKS